MTTSSQEPSDSVSKLYASEAILFLRNEFPWIRAKAIKAVFGFLGRNFSRAFVCLSSIEAQRECIVGSGRGHFIQIPGDVDPFIKAKRRIKRFEVECLELCAEIDEIRGNNSTTPASVPDKSLLATISHVERIVDTAKERHPELREMIKTFNVESSLTAMLDLRREYIDKGKSGDIDIGYHNTKADNIQSIERNGLLSRADRTRNNVEASQNNGNVFGNGIYTGNDPETFRRYGDTSLIVARLKGTQIKVPIKLRDGGLPSDVDTIIGNKIVHPVRMGSNAWPLNGYRDETVLRSSSQCVALIRFNQSLGSHPDGKKCIDFLHNSLMEIFSKQSKRQPKEIKIYNALSWRKAIQLHSFEYEAPLALNSCDFPTKFIEAPITRVCNPNEACVICCKTLASGGRCVALPICKTHVFHQECIEQALRKSPRCPSCQMHIVEPQGKSPSGRMTVMIDPDVRCEGHNDVATIVITYDIPDGIQGGYHECPGKYYAGKFSSAYIPNHTLGRDLLKRLTFAFTHGLTFTVGTSSTTGRANQCTWASIPHKTSIKGGNMRYGYPDAGYFLNAKKELDALGVPSAGDLDGSGQPIPLVDLTAETPKANKRQKTSRELSPAVAAPVAPVCLVESAPAAVTIAPANANNPTTQQPPVAAPCLMEGALAALPITPANANSPTTQQPSAAPPCLMEGAPAAAPIAPANANNPTTQQPPAAPPYLMEGAPAAVPITSANANNPTTQQPSAAPPCLMEGAPAAAPIAPADANNLTSQQPPAVPPCLMEGAPAEVPIAPANANNPTTQQPSTAPPCLMEGAPAEVPIATANANNPTTQQPRPQSRRATGALANIQQVKEPQKAVADTAAPSCFVERIQMPHKGAPAAVPAVPARGHAIAPVSAPVGPAPSSNITTQQPRPQSEGTMRTLANKRQKAKSPRETIVDTTAPACFVERIQTPHKGASAAVPAMPAPGHIIAPAPAPGSPAPPSNLTTQQPKPKSGGTMRESTNNRQRVPPILTQSAAPAAVDTSSQKRYITQQPSACKLQGAMLLLDFASSNENHPLAQVATSGGSGGFSRGTTVTVGRRDKMEKNTPRSNEAGYVQHRKVPLQITLSGSVLAIVILGVILNKLAWVFPRSLQI